MITFHNVEKKFRVKGGGFRVVLNNVNLHLPSRNIAVLGGNGQGKSTLLRMISGGDKPTSGRIECNRRVSFPLGFSGSFNPALTGIENSLFVSRIYGRDRDEVVEYVKEFTQLGEELYWPVGNYSSGMRARLAFGVSLALDFEIYLVDEITAVGDASFRDRSKAAFKAKMDKARILMVSHSMGTLRDYCDAGLILNKGQLTFYDDLEEAIKVHADIMGGDPDQFMTPEERRAARIAQRQAEREANRDPAAQERIREQRRAARIAQRQAERRGLGPSSEI